MSHLSELHDILKEVWEVADEALDLIDSIDGCGDTHNCEACAFTEDRKAYLIQLKEQLENLA